MVTVSDSAGKCKEFVNVADGGAETPPIYH